MGKRGPPKTPTRLRILRGNPSKERLPTNEPQPPADDIAPPEWCTGEAARLFNDYAAKLTPLGLLTNIDCDALGMYAVTMMAFRRHLDICQRGGDINVILDDNGKVKLTQPSGSNTIVKQSIDRMIRLAQQFGMTPSARTSLATPDGKAADPLAAWLSKQA